MTKEEFYGTALPKLKQTEGLLLKEIEKYVLDSNIEGQLKYSQFKRETLKEQFNKRRKRS